MMVDLGRCQSVIYQSAARFRVLIAGRRWGKTTLACVELLAAALLVTGSVNWYVAPTRDMAKDLAWEPLKKLAAPYTRKTNETDLVIWLRNGSVIALFSADRPERLVGRGLSFVVMDEFVQIAEELWVKSIRPALADKRGRALFISTPQGMNWGYDLWLRGQDAGRGTWVSWQFTTLDGERVTAQEVEDAKEDMDERTFRQEFLATFETAAGRIYDSFSMVAVPLGNLDASLVDDIAAPLLVGMDFNVNPMSAVFAIKRVDELHVVGALQVLTSNTSEMASDVSQKFPNRRVVVYPDPSGKARKTSAPVGQTDFTLLREAGFEIIAPGAAPAIVDRYNAVNALLCNAKGRRRLLVHPSAAPLIKALSGFQYKPGTSLADKTSGYDHITDALGYLVWSGCNPLPNHRVAVFDFSLG